MKKKNRFLEHEALHIIKDLLNGFLALLKEGIIHRYFYYSIKRSKIGKYHVHKRSI